MKKRKKWGRRAWIHSNNKDKWLNLNKWWHLSMKMDTRLVSARAEARRCSLVWALITVLWSRLLLTTPSAWSILITRTLQSDTRMKTLSQIPWPWTAYVKLTQSVQFKFLIRIAMKEALRGNRVLRVKARRISAWLPAEKLPFSASNSKEEAILIRSKNKSKSWWGVSLKMKLITILRGRRQPLTNHAPQKACWFVMMRRSS